MEQDSGIAVEPEGTECEDRRHRERKYGLQVFRNDFGKASRLCGGGGPTFRLFSKQRAKEDRMSAKPVIRKPGENKGVALRGYPMVFLVTGTDTKHTSMFDWTIPPGFATGRHVHRVQEETFFVLEGECEWHAGDEVIRATPGTYLFLPPGVPHNITNVSDKPARVLMTVSPPGHEHYFEELARLTEKGAPDPKAIGDLRARYDTTQLSALTARE
jgi:quercetin dioxygenase-like cupin family protein